MTIQLSRAEARRLAVAGQLLDGPRPSGLMGVVRALGRVQVDPVAAVARAEQMVIFSRLGPYEVTEIEAALERGQLFEYWANLVPTADFGIHRETMRRYPRGETVRAAYTRDWLAANATFRRYVLRELRRRGPLRSRELEDRHVVPWHTGGWSDGKGLSLMLDTMWFRGDITVSNRHGGERIWDLAERQLPLDEPRRPQAEIAREVVEAGLRRRGVARRRQFGTVFDGEPPGAAKAFQELVREGIAVPVSVADLRGPWWAHRDLLERAPRAPRTVLLSPFDRLIHDRGRTEEIFGFRYRLEMYVPKDKREFGYYVLPILHGERLIGRVDPLLDRKAGVLHVNGVWAEPGAPGAAGPDVAAAIRELAEWIGASEVRFARPLPRAWAASLRA